MKKIDLEQMSTINGGSWWNFGDGFCMVATLVATASPVGVACIIYGIGRGTGVLG